MLLLVPGIVRVDPLVARHCGAVEHDLIEGIAVDREAQRLPDARILAERVLGRLAVRDVDRHPHVAEVDAARELEALVRLDLLDVGGKRPLDHVELPRLEVREPDGRIRDGQVGDAVDPDPVLVPVIGEALDHDAVLLHALDELIGTGADGLLAELVAGLLSGLGRDHHAGPVGQLGQQRRIGILQQQPDGRRIHHLDLVDGRDLGPAERALHGQMPLERKLHSLRVHRLAVMEFDARAKLDRDRLSVSGSVVRERELRDDVELAVRVEELVAERGKDDAADIGAAEARIEHVRILGKADAQVRLRCCKGRETQGTAEKCSAKGRETRRHRNLRTARAYATPAPGPVRLSASSCSAMKRSMASRPTMPDGRARDGSARR